MQYNSNKINTLVLLMTKVRLAQKDYFKTRDIDKLKECKVLESLLDTELKLFNTTLLYQY